MSPTYKELAKYCATIAKHFKQIILDNKDLFVNEYNYYSNSLHDECYDNFANNYAQEIVYIVLVNHKLNKPTEIDNRFSGFYEFREHIYNVDITAIIKNYNESTKSADSIIYFYETFLEYYDKALKKKLGIWYTPIPIVNFMISETDKFIKECFSLENGLANDNICILDPATGTGTYLYNVLRFIKNNYCKDNFSEFISNKLGKDIKAFEILNVSRQTALLKLSQIIEEDIPLDTIRLCNTLSNEPTIYNQIFDYNKIPIIIGNPPYNSKSKNKFNWLLNLIQDYKRIGNEKIKEQKITLVDDYVQFIRYAQHIVSLHGQGMVAYITNNGFIDNITYRGMRYSLLKTFDKIYIVNLHGNGRKREKCADGKNDENVFNIMQGVCIVFMIKDGSKEGELGSVYTTSLMGNKEYKFEELFNHTNGIF